MNQTHDNTAIQGSLPAIWEFFRAVSGVVAIIALLGIAAGTSRLEESGNRLPGVTPLAASAQPPQGVEQANTGSPSLPAQLDTMVFYLVSTPEEEDRADWGENVDATDSRRRYQILDARDETEGQAAHQAVIDYILSRPETMQVRVIDLRSGR